MTTQVGIGWSSLGAASSAVAESAQRAARSVRSKVSLAFVFASPKYPKEEVAQAAFRAFGQNVVILGCSTAGEIANDHVSHGGISVLLVAGDIEAHGALASGVREDPGRAAQSVTADFGMVQRRASKQGLTQSTTIAFVDGLAGTGEELVELIRGQIGGLRQIAGGAAGDEGKLEETWVSLNGAVDVDGVSVAHIFSSRSWAIGVDHGLVAASDTYRVTRSLGTKLYELDGRPVMEVYQDYAKSRGLTFDPNEASDFLINHELGVYVFDKFRKARAPLFVADDGAFACAAPIPQGASVAMLDGKKEALVAAATRAAEEAKSRLGDHPAAGLLVFDCICRGAILKDDFKEEIRAIRSVFPGVPLAGFVTYGEIAKYAGRLDGWHNTTVVVVAIPA